MTLVAVIATVIIAVYQFKNQTNFILYRKVFSVFLVAFSFFLFLFALKTSLQTGISLGNNLRNGKYHTVEGVVENFVPAPWEGLQDESFTVNGVHFSYADFVVNGGFHRTSSHGGPIGAGKYVKINYAYGVILQLWIKETN